MKYLSKPKLLATSIFLSTASMSFVADSATTGIERQMESLFTEMTNVTPPGVHETQRRGVIAGGRFTTKTKIFDQNIVNFAPPSWKAGCGGVDLFGGSFSFINADQIVQLLRTVAANAKGYAFQLALDSVFPMGSKWIDTFQKKVQALNQHLGNSCQLAQGFVNDLTSGMDLKNKTDASLAGTATGLFNDFFDSKQELSGQSPMEELKANQPDEYNKLIGNLVWKQLKQNNVNTWFSFGDNELLEAIMSLTGSAIIGDLIDDPNPTASGAKTNPITPLPGYQITMSDLVFGGNIKPYTCGGDTENCLSPVPIGAPISLKGISPQIMDMLVGTPATPGIIYKFSNNQGTLSATEIAFMSNLPNGVGTIIRNLSVLSYDSATIFATEASSSIAVAMMYSLTMELFRAARLSLATSKSPYRNEALSIIDQSQRQVESEYRVLSAQYGDLSEQIARYNALLSNIRKQKYMLSTLTTPPTTN